MGKNTGKNISENLSSKCSQKIIDHAKLEYAADPLRTASKGEIKKSAEVTGDLIRNKITDEITRASKTYLQN